MPLNELSMLEVGQTLANGDASAVDVVEACFREIARVEGTLQAFLAKDERGAIEAARASDDRRRAGRSLGPLDGVPVALKDNILTQGLESTAGSKILEGFIPPYDAAVTRHCREAGMPILGKCNLDEFGMGSSTEASAFQKTRNPFDPTRTPGGSSGGSAAAVASRMAFGALGTDTGGSVRQPAALCNVVGLKPTWGRVSRYGVIAYASSLDQVGTLTRTVADAAAWLKILAQPDDRDATCSRDAPPDYLQGLEEGVRGLRVGLPREYFVEGMDAEVEASVHSVASLLQRLGATVVELSLPHTPQALAAYYIVATAEASSNLARYDGVRFGHRAGAITTLDELYTKSRSEGFGDEVKRRIMLGTFALSAGYHDAYYTRAEKVRTLIRQDFEHAFAEVDVVLAATSPVPAWKLGDKLENPLQMYLMDALTIPCSLAGLPGISLPSGFTSAGLPLGVQLIGRAFDEASLLRAARAIERETKFANRAPAVVRKT
jgi:aspartyl-tRNA(Asn)/glutamyl-tRNA(Gln) amidotransferase subunit A